MYFIQGALSLLQTIESGRDSVQFVRDGGHRMDMIFHPCAGRVVDAAIFKFSGVVKQVIGFILLCPLCGLTGSSSSSSSFFSKLGQISCPDGLETIGLQIYEPGMEWLVRGWSTLRWDFHWGGCVLQGMFLTVFTVSAESAHALAYTTGSMTVHNYYWLNPP